MQQISKKAPFAWVGGKSKLAKEIVPLMPQHTTYVEVFGGALSVFYTKAPSRIEVVNDINSDLINLHQIIKTRPQSLSIYLGTMLKSRELFELIKNGKLKPKNKIEQAAFYFYLLTQSFGSKAKHFAMSKNRSSKHLIKDFKPYQNRLKQTTIENLSYEKLIREYDGKDTLFYLDPPYVGAESYYKLDNKFGIDEHIKLSNILKEIKGKFMLS